MSDQEILTKAIERAMAGGWSRLGLTDEGEMHFTEHGIVVDLKRGGRDFVATEAIIFNHDFAKALWGELTYIDQNYVDLSEYDDGITNDMGWTNKNATSATLDGDYSYRELTAWQYHLQQMVIADDPIKYLANNI